MRRVALALESSGPGGAETLLLQLGVALREAGDAPMLVTLREGWMTEHARAARLEVHVLPQRPGLDPGWVVRFARFLRRERIEILHSHEFAMNVYGGLAARLARIPAVATLHGRHYVTEAARRRLAYRLLRRTGMPLVAVSHDLADFLAAGLGVARARVEVIHNGIVLPPPPPADPAGRARRRQQARFDTGLETRGLRAIGSAPLLLAVGNLYGVKGHATLVRALAKLDAAHVAIAGRGGEEDALRRLAQELGVAERMHLLGLRDDVERLLAAADLFVHPSHSEGLPLAVLEAMAAGLPVVASRVGGLVEALEDGVTGRLVEPGDSGALVTALQALLDDPMAAAALGVRARARVEREFSAAAMCAAYRALYDRALGG